MSPATDLVIFWIKIFSFAVLVAHCLQFFDLTDVQLTTRQLVWNINWLQSVHSLFENPLAQNQWIVKLSFEKHTHTHSFRHTPIHNHDVRGPDRVHAHMQQGHTQGHAFACTFMDTHRHTHTRGFIHHTKQFEWKIVLKFMLYTACQRLCALFCYSIIEN